MPIEKMVDSVHLSRRNAVSVFKKGTKIIFTDPTILAYSVFATIFVLLTYATVSGLVLAVWHNIFPHQLADVSQDVPSKLKVVLGIATFYYFYTAVVAVYFTCATSAAVWAKLEGHPTTLFHGLWVVLRHFWRVSKFAILSIFFIPLGFISQWRKLPKGIVGVVGSSLTLHSANMAPAILNEKSGVFATVRASVDTLSKVWKEGLIIKLGTWTMLLVLIGISFLPKLIEHIWFSVGSSHWLSWLITSVLLAASFVITKVFGGVLMTILYHQAKSHSK